MWDLWPWLAAMGLLVGCSALFSASEAAFFSLRAAERRTMASGGARDRLAASLLREPDRLLSTVLFWNLVVNIGYFALSSVLTLRIEADPDLGQSAAVLFALVSLLVLIFCSEMLPKSLGVMKSRLLARLLGWPLAIAARAADPLLPAMRLVTVLSRRMIWPGFEPERSMEVDDLRGAIEASTQDDQLILQEQAVLRNLVEISTIRVDEWMRPRSQFRTFRAPVAISDLNGQIPPGGYLLVAEPDSDEIGSALHLESQWDLREDHLEYLAEPVEYLPWCTTLAEALERMKRLDREVIAVVNEHGETIGILTYEDLLDTLFSYAPSRSKRLLDLNPIHRIGPDKWLVSGMTSLKRLSNELQTSLPPTRNVTVSGVIQESLQRVAGVGDICEWGPVRFRVLEMPHRGHMLIEMTTRPPAEDA